MPYILAWLLGVPATILVLVWLINHVNRRPSASGVTPCSIGGAR